MRYDSGYAWELTNNNELVSIYKKTREGSIIQNLLCDFKGILVTGFYSAYDSINCIQKKCLIHLIRDMNDDLLTYPFHSELYLFKNTLTNLVQEIVCTIDSFGLKKIYLSIYA